MDVHEISTGYPGDLDASRTAAVLNPYWDPPDGLEHVASATGETHGAAP
jgi:hypothetical protein